MGMRNPVHTILAVICALGASSLACADERALLDELRAALISAPVVSTFRGIYTLENRNGAGERIYLKRYEHRFRGPDFYLRIEDLVDNTWMPLTFVCVNGLYAIRVESSCSISAELDIGFLQIPWGAYLTPQELLGEIFGKPLSEILLEGQSTLSTRNGQTVLSHRYGERQVKGIDIYFDDQGLVSKIEQCMRPSFSEEEIRTQWVGDLFDVRSLRTTVELRDYQLIGGAMLPTSATKTWWGMDDSRSTNYYSLAKAGTMSWLEASVKDYTSNVRIPSVIQTFTLDVPTVEVNEQVSDLDLSLSLPAGTEVTDRQTRKKYMVASASPKWRGAITHFFASRDGARSLNERFGVHLAAGTAFVSAEPFADWLKPTLVAGFAASLGSLSILELFRRRKRKCAARDTPQDGSEKR